MPQTFDSRVNESDSKIGMSFGMPTLDQLQGLADANPFLFTTGKGKGKKIQKGLDRLHERQAEGTLDTKKGRRLQKRLTNRLRKKGQLLHKLASKHFAKNELTRQLSEVGDLRNRAKGLANQNITNVDNQARRESEQLGLETAAQAAQAGQQGPGAGAGFGAQLDSSLRTAKARAGINTRGEEAIKNQQLKDRMKIAGQGVDLRGTALRSLGEARRIREGFDVGMRDIKDASAQGNADALGGILGGLSAQIANTNKNKTVGNLAELDPSEFAPKQRSGSLSPGGS